MRISIIQEEISALVEAAETGSLDAETLSAGIEAVRQVPIESQDFLDTPQMPESAGEHRELLERLMARIPPGWGRWVDCGPGWYPILAELDEKLSDLIPRYEIHQIKEKYGTLRFYWGVPERVPACCAALDATDPRPENGAIYGPLVPPGRSAAVQELLESWWGRRREHLESEEHEKRVAELINEAQRNGAGRIGSLVAVLVDEAEERSARTCEECGAGAVLRVREGWFRTLCAACGEKMGYTATSS